MTTLRGKVVAPVLRPVRTRVCILMACADMSEADQVGQLLSEMNTGCLVTYRQAGDMMLNVPADKVALVILATDEAPAALGRTLKWLRHRWPGCPITVVGDSGANEYEMAARAGGALYLTRPVVPQNWTDILSHTLTGRHKQTTQEKSKEGVLDQPS